MKRCINCGNLLAQKDRDVCLRCLTKTLGQDKTAVIKQEENKNEKSNN